jgi:RecB family exonuclease
MAQSLIAADFVFSQSSLQAYEDCPRRFWHLYVERLPWPAVEASPVHEHEMQLRQGEAFHRIVQRAEIGIDPALLAGGLEPPLDQWFAGYRELRPSDLPRDNLVVERLLTTPFAFDNESQAMVALTAKYDLIARRPDGRVVIVDWKTGRRRGDPNLLRQRLQTIIYLYVLVEAGHALPWWAEGEPLAPLQPEQVEMRYWFTAAPADPVVFAYDSRQHQANRRRLQRLLTEISAGRSADDFAKIPDTEANRRSVCGFCVYRSHCNRGVAAADLAPIDDVEELAASPVQPSPDFTLEEVSELAF